MTAADMPSMTIGNNTSNFSLLMMWVETIIQEYEARYMANSYAQARRSRGGFHQPYGSGVSSIPFLVSSLC
jgi:hypothetical protein